MQFHGDRLNSLLKCPILRNLIDRNSHYYMYLENRDKYMYFKDNVRRCLEFFIWLESSSTLNFVSERDPGEIVQTHMLS